MQKHLMEKYVKPTVTELIGKLNAEWSDDVAIRLHEALGDYLELATSEHLSRKDEPTPKPKQTPVVAVGNGEPNPYELKGTCLKKAPEGMPAYIPHVERKPRRHKGELVANMTKVFEHMTKSGNLGKVVTLVPDELSMSLEDLRVTVSKFNYSKWRERTCPNSKLRYKNNVANVTCQMVRADEDYRGKRFGFN